MNQIFMKCQMRFIDISKNQIVLRFLDNLIVTAGYKFNLESFLVEGNQRAYSSKNSVCSCLPFSKYRPEDSSEYAFTKVSPLQLYNRNQRVIDRCDMERFIQAKVNVRKEKLAINLSKFRETVLQAKQQVPPP
jgi:hypothetical protein